MNFPCPGYNVPEMRPEVCLDNQLSLFCLVGWPCHVCPNAVGLGLPVEGEREPRGHADPS